MVLRPFSPVREIAKQCECKFAILRNDFLQCIFQRPPHDEIVRLFVSVDFYSCHPPPPAASSIVYGGCTSVLIFVGDSGFVTQGKITSESVLFGDLGLNTSSGARVRWLLR